MGTGKVGNTQYAPVGSSKRVQWADDRGPLSKMLEISWDLSLCLPSGRLRKKGKWKWAWKWEWRGGGGQERGRREKAEKLQGPRLAVDVMRKWPVDGWLSSCAASLTIEFAL